MYNFKDVCYHKQCRLWTTAARECEWAASPLVICEADLSKPWSPIVTVSDACLSGTATCSLKADACTVREISKAQELWRYEGNGAALKARDAVKKLDPFQDVETVLPWKHFLTPSKLTSTFKMFHTTSPPQMIGNCSLQHQCT